MDEKGFNKLKPWVLCFFFDCVGVHTGVNASKCCLQSVPHSTDCNQNEQTASLHVEMQTPASENGCAFFIDHSLKQMPRCFPHIHKLCMCNLFALVLHALAVVGCYSNWDSLVLT